MRSVTKQAIHHMLPGNDSHTTGPLAIMLLQNPDMFKGGSNRQLSRTPNFRNDAQGFIARVILPYRADKREQHLDYLKGILVQNKLMDTIIKVEVRNLFHYVTFIASNDL
ncbi:MAG: hypothetical protein L0154_08420 [Chloroflexi bacterium]|nr:hypothetical protein [Chloroflexota bacterium]